MYIVNGDPTFAPPRSRLPSSASQAVATPALPAASSSRTTARRRSVAARRSSRRPTTGRRSITTRRGSPDSAGRTLLANGNLFLHSFEFQRARARSPTTRTIPRRRGAASRIPVVTQHRGAVLRAVHRARRDFGYFDRLTFGARRLRPARRRQSHVPARRRRNAGGVALRLRPVALDADLSDRVGGVPRHAVARRRHLRSPRPRASSIRRRFSYADLGRSSARTRSTSRATRRARCSASGTVVRGDVRRAWCARRANARVRPARCARRTASPRRAR